ncbi:MAG: mandelate racemase/muconate lactonizing enzyme family protein [Alphaproteobacteria bacterium]|nr:mandelate racemase/muconate lactonizing enzyme family protein [Alphaproteobacteria bacterium]
MKITAIAAIQLAEFPNLLWVEIESDEGIVGLGETFYGASAVAAFIHETAAPYLLGKDPLQIEKHNRHFLNHYLGFKSVGAEMRGASAIDIALWDLFGQASQQPVYQLLGGKTRESVRTYNTCAGYQYVRAEPEQLVTNWGLPTARGKKRPYEDLDAFLHRADDLAESLLAEGYQGMKIWPFDFAAEASGGTRITAAELKTALAPFEKVRKRVGDKIDIHVEFHSLWNLPMAIRLAKALEPFQPYWYEDPLKMDDLGALADYAHRTDVWVTASETLGTRWAFRDLFEKRAVSIAMLDIGWTGGLSEAKKIAAMAEAYQLPVAPHDCTGPVMLTAAAHLSLNAANTLVQEVVRAFYHDWYGEIVTTLPPLQNGFITAPEGPGLGTKLQPRLKQRPDATVRRSAV